MLGKYLDYKTTAKKVVKIDILIKKITDNKYSMLLVDKNCILGDALINSKYFDNMEDVFVTSEGRIIDLRRSVN